MWWALLLLLTLIFQHATLTHLPPRAALVLFGRTPAHCIEYAHLILWSQQRSHEEFDTDDEEHMQWVYSNALARAKQYGIEVSHLLRLRRCRQHQDRASSCGCNGMFEAIVLCCRKRSKWLSACSRTL